MQTITRRDFLKVSATTTLGAALATPSAWLAASKAPDGTVVAVARGTDYEPLLVAALEKNGGAPCLARRGERVVLKPTAAWNRAPHLAANTNPFVVQALARLCLDAGARTVTIFDRTSFRADLCYSISGLTGALAQFRPPQVRLITLTAADFVPAGESGTRLCRHALEADRFINVPQAKHHAFRGVALGAANLLGAVSGGAPLNDDFLVWSLRRLKPSLTVLDATRLLVRNGPAGGAPSDVEYRKTLAMSRDPLAVDAFGCGLLGRDWREFNYLRLGAEAGLGEPDLSRTTVVEV
jgi:uncharacterized protein (DUF362 family)